MRINELVDILSSKDMVT